MTFLKVWHDPLMPEPIRGFTKMRPYVAGMDVSHVSISETDKQNGSPKHGDMIAVNHNDDTDQWLVAENFFHDHYR